MNKTEIEKIMKNLIKLKGQPFNELSRASTMLCLGFGEKIKGEALYKTADGTFEIKEMQRSKYALHIECMFRICFDDKVLLTREAMFKPSIKMQDEEFDESFDWDTFGNNKLDEELSEFFDFSKKALTVKDIQINKFGDLIITLSNNYNVEIFVDTEEDEECWRFFETGKTEETHIVMTGCGYCEQ